ncbi:MAG: hypothetical protein RJA99_1132 [Pseudomonadota bacterium]|jgi:uncharacterized membrane protein (DUF4010 family)
MDPVLLADAWRYGTGLAIGLLVGIERERKRDSRGVRTFALVSLLGTLIGGLARDSALPGIVPAGLVLIAALSIAAYWADHRVHDEPPTTSMVAMTLTGALGMLCGLGNPQLAVTLAVVVAALLVFKTELHGVAGRIGRDDLIPVLQFGALTFVALPLVPDRAYGPNGSLNPREIWLMVVLVAGVGLAGYLLLRFAGRRFGAPLAAVAGGLVSSTATTLVFARHARAGGGTALAAGMVVLSNLTMLVRLAILAAVAQPALLPGVAAVAGAAIVASVPVALWLLPRARREGELPLPQVSNPTDLRVALGFGIAYGAISLIAAWATARVGEGGLYAVAAVSGLTDVDAITLTALRLHGDGRIDTQGAVSTIAIAVVANLVFKAGVARVAGNAALARPVAAGFATMAAAIAATVLVLRAMAP